MNCDGCGQPEDTELFTTRVSIEGTLKTMCGMCWVSFEIFLIQGRHK